MDPAHIQQMLRRFALFALLLVPGVASANTPWSGTFSYGARGGAGQATARGTATHATAAARTEGSPSHYAYAEGRALGGNGSRAVATAESGLPTLEDQFAVQRGQFELRSTEIDIGIAELQRGVERLRKLRNRASATRSSIGTNRWRPTTYPPQSVPSTPLR